MADIGKTVVREPQVDTPEQYRRHVYMLAGIYISLFVIAVLGFVLLIWKGQLFVTLTQRSNVETLALAFFLVLFLYVAFISYKGAIGATRIAYYGLLTRFSKDRNEVEQRKIRALGPPKGENPEVALNIFLEKEGQPGEPFEIRVADEVSSAGAIRSDGVRVTHLEAHRYGSNNLFAFFSHQVNDVLRRRGIERYLDIVDWKKIDDEATEAYFSLAHFARNLEKQLGAAELWPKVTLTEADCAEVERRLSAICRSLRDEAFLPDWEYRAEHKLPIIPEPLGLASLSRSERRADPLASMGSILLIVIFVVAVLGLFIVFPPWVPG